MMEKHWRALREQLLSSEQAPQLHAQDSTGVTQATALEGCGLTDIPVEVSRFPTVAVPRSGEDQPCGCDRFCSTY